MFAKLKEKIQKEAGSLGEGERTLQPLPGHASPRRISLTGSPAQSPLSKDRPSTEDLSALIEDASKTDYNTKEEMLAALQRSRDVCRKQETQLNDYSSVIKDNTKKIEKLENFIERQQDAVAKKSQELNEQYQASRVKMTDNFKLQMEKKENELQVLQKQLDNTESMKVNYYKKEEEKEEMNEFVTQEMGKLKHMLIMKEEELAVSERELREKTALLETEVKAGRDLRQELTILEQKLKTIEADRSHLEEESVGHGKMVSALTKERITLEESLTQLKTQLAEKSTSLSSLQSKHTDLESLHQTLVRNSDIHKNKTTQQLQEKDDQIDQLGERVKLLEQREQDHTLSGDDRLVALEKERDGLERKLTETREQLSQIKSSWSEKISHLEDQISHLNGKIVEDNEELSQAQTYTDTVRQNMQKEIENLKTKLADSEKQAEANLELVKSKEAVFKKEKLELETEISRVELDKVEMTTQCRVQTASLETQLSSTETTWGQEKGVLEDQITKYRHDEKETEERQARTDRQLEELETTKNKLQGQIKDWEKLCENLKLEVRNKEKQLADLNGRYKTLEEKLDSFKEKLETSKEKLESSKEKSKGRDTELQMCNKEKDGLMLRNAELSQQVMTLQRASQDSKQTHKEDRRVLEDDLNVRTDTVNTLTLQCTQLQHKVEELSASHTANVSNSEQITRLQETVTALEDQLADKTKTIKKQEQRLNDLKKTLQRELKVQALPNDEPIDAKMAALTPPLQRKNSFTRTSHHMDNSRTKRQNSREHSPYTSDITDPHETSQNSYGVQDFFVGQNLVHGQDRTNYSGVKNSHGHATIPVNDRLRSATNHLEFQGSQNGGHSRTVREFDTRHLEKDVNFMYLKHVVMKFMLSREHEAIHLIKAVSLLLRFTPDEQKLIKDTLEWKMSWFGGAAPPAVLKGHANKIIPPSY